MCLVRKKFRFGFFTIIFFSLATFVTARAEQTYDHGPIFSLIEENDLIVKTDRHYTQGIKLSYLHKDGFFPLCSSNIYEGLPEWGFTKKQGKVGYEIGQNIYTPGNLMATSLLPNDRPYAGWLYTGLVLQRRGETASGWPVLESFQLDLGVIGPWSLAKEAQTWVHQLRGFDVPRGWSNQLKNEPGIEIKYQRSIRFRGHALHPLDFEFIPHAGFSLGNVETTGRVGGQFRIGLNLPDDYGIQTIDSLTTTSGGHSRSQTFSRWGCYVFASSEGKAVGHNAFLDGNLFHNSHSVDKEYLVGDFKAGFAFVLPRAEIGFSYVLRTREFHGQTEPDRFGSVYLKAKF